MQNSYTCPVCHVPIELLPKPGDPNRLQGFCNHGNMTKKATCVVEIGIFNAPVEVKKRKGKKL